MCLEVANKRPAAVVYQSSTSAGGDVRALMKSAVLFLVLGVLSAVALAQEPTPQDQPSPFPWTNLIAAVTALAAIASALVAYLIYRGPIWKRI